MDFTDLKDAIERATKAVKDLLESLLENYADLVGQLTEDTVYEFQHSEHRHRSAEPVYNNTVNYVKRVSPIHETPEHRLAGAKQRNLQ